MGHQVSEHREGWLPSPDLTRWTGPEGHTSDAFAEVVKYARSIQYAYAWTAERFCLLKGKRTVTVIPMTSFREDPLQAARNLLEAITLDADD